MPWRRYGEAPAAALARERRSTLGTEIKFPPRARARKKVVRAMRCSSCGLPRRGSLRVSHIHQPVQSRANSD